MMTHFYSVVLALLLVASEARNLKGKETFKCKKKKKADTCSISPESLQGVCDHPSSLKVIVNSCGDVYGPTVIERAKAAAGHDLSTLNNKKEVYSEAWKYMMDLEADNLILGGDNVYNDAIANWGAGYHPYGKNWATILTDASDAFMKYHGYLNEDGSPGVLNYGYLELMKDKLNDGYFSNDEFNCLREQLDEAVHATWDDHDYFTNDPANPNPLQAEIRKASIDKLTGWDKKYFRFGAPHKGIERTWTQEISDFHGKPFLIRFIILDEETTHQGSQGCTYYFDPSSEQGFAPRQTKDKAKSCPDLDYLEDFESPSTERVFYGDDQINWFKEQLMKPADLIFVYTGGPNFEIDYDYNSITEFPGDKRKFIEALRESGAEHVIFMGGDSHATYVTETPNIVGYPLYTIIGSGLTSGLSYDRYVGYWGDISHRFLVAAGSTNHNNRAASFAEVDVYFDEKGAIVRFTPHIREGLDEGGWDYWYPQIEPNADEPWDARYEIRVSDLEIDPSWPRYHVDPSIEHKWVPETIYLKWASTAASVVLSVTNTKGVTKHFPLEQGHNCGAGNFGFCKDKWGAFTYTETKKGTYQPSKEQQILCEHAGFVGDVITWAILEDGVEAASGSVVLKIRNNVFVNTAGAIEDLYHYGTQGAYASVEVANFGINVLDIINEPPVYGGYKVPVKGWNGNSFDDAAVQAAYVSGDRTALQATYLSTYYPELPQL